MPQHDTGERFRALIDMMNTQREAGKDANDAWGDQLAWRQDNAGLAGGFFAEGEALLEESRASSDQVPSPTATTQLEAFREILAARRQELAQENGMEPTRPHQQERDTGYGY